MISFRTDTLSMRALSILDVAHRNTQDRLRNLASGDRLQRSATDAAGSGIASELHAKRLSLRMAMDNSDNALSTIAVAEGGMAQITNNLNRMRQLAVTSASGSLGNDVRAFLDQEFVALSDEITRIAGSSRWGDLTLLDSAQLHDVQVGIDGTSNSRITIVLDDLRANAANMGVDAGSTDVLTASNARSAIGDVDRALDYVLGLRSGLGATQNRIESAYRLADGMRFDTLDAEQRIRDVDTAHEMAELVKQRITTDTALSFVMQARQISRTAARLLD